MREIKFRVWDKTNKTMKIPVLIDFEMSLVRCLCNSGLSVRSFDEVILLQYTGLKDKNNKEIYEGDIVKVKEKLLKEEPVYDSETGEFMGMDYFEKERERTAIVKWKVDGFHLISSQAYEYEIEVIGNIYENPELLQT